MNTLLDTDNQPFKQGVRVEDFEISSWKAAPPAYYGDYDAYSVDIQVMKSGAVLVFMLYEGEYLPIPIRLCQTQEHTFSVDVVFTLRRVRVIWTDEQENDNTIPPPIKIKIIVLPPEVKERFPNLKRRSFNDVAKTFNISAQD